MKQLIKFLCLLLVLTGCKTQKIDFTIPQKTLPKSFKIGDASNTIAEIDWHHYFSDPHLIKLIDTALASNPDLQIALQRVEYSKAGLLSARGALKPTVSAQLSPAVRKYGLYTMDGAGNVSTDILPDKMVPEHLPDFYLGLQSSWEIDIWKKLRNRERAAFSNYLASSEGINFAKTTLITQVALAYYDLIALDNELEFLTETILNQEQVLEVIKYHKEAGRANELMVQQFKAQQLNTQTLQRQVIQSINEAENKINFLLGRYPQPIERSKAELYRNVPEIIEAGIPSQLLLHRPDVRAANYRLQAARFDVKAANAEFLPRITLSAGLGYQAFNPKYLLNTPASIAYSLVGGLMAPLVNKNAIQAKFDMAKSSQIMAMYEYQKAIIGGYTEVVNELSRINALAEISKLKTAQSQVLEASVSTSNELYSAAKATYLEVLVAQQNALYAKLEMVNAHKMQLTASVNIYRALGGGWK